MSDDSDRAEMVRHIDLDLIDHFAAGWKQAVIHELDRMRAEMPYADTLELRLICERKETR